MIGILLLPPFHSCHLPGWWSVWTGEGFDYDTDRDLSIFIVLLLLFFPCLVCVCYG